MSNIAMSKIQKFSPLLALLLLGACVSAPTGPSVMVFPGTGKSFDQFRGDDMECRQYAFDQNGGTNATAAANDSVVRSAALGTVLGAVAGAAINGSHGAGVGAGTGLLIGGMAGTSAGQASAYGTQQRYDFAYQQCMYAKGHRVPAASRFSNDPRQGYYPPPPPGYRGY